VPAIVAVPLPLSVSETPGGNAPDAANVGLGKPVAVNAKLLGTAIGKDTAATLVIAGGCAIVNVKFCVATTPAPFPAVRVNA
jgi:hypothetical protein